MSSLPFNQAQREAIESDLGPVCIIAGPGTGKTMTLTARIAYMVETRHVDRSSILALTFTNKAAKELRDRLTVLIGPRGLPLTTTFHAFALLVIRNLEREELPQFITEAQRHKVAAALKKSGQYKQLSVRDMLLAISRAKNIPDGSSDKTIRQLVAAYDSELAAKGWWDFDDVLRRLYIALTDNESFRTGLQQRYRHLLVDEFQDTNSLQYAILRLLAPSGDMFVIGDPLQSIYGFRGADASIFAAFKQDWPQARTITLTTNYRSMVKIVDLANAIFPEAAALVPHTQEAGSLQLVEVLNEYSEAQWVIDHIEQELGGSDLLKTSHYSTLAGQRTFRDFAVLSRTHAAARITQQKLEESGIPYQVAGEGSPYQRPHVMTILESLAYVDGSGPLPEMSKLTPSQMAALLEPLRATYAAMPLSELIARLGELFGIDKPEQQRDLQQLRHTLLRFERQPLREYLDYVQSIADQGFYDPSAEAVTLLTIHAAKGLEFARVFLLAAEQGILPLTGASADRDEEQRLFYVAITRAREGLDILHTRVRGGQPSEQSVFIRTIPSTILTAIVDPGLETQQRRIEKSRRRRAQTSLF